MSEADRSDVLKRKARTGREEHQARVMTPPRALRLALARVADERFGMALSVSSIHVAEAGQDGTVAAFAEDRLIMVLDGPQGATGAAAVDVAVLAGLIEMQTMGQVLTRPPDLRAPTQTDAALAAPLIDGMLAGLAENLEDDAAALAWAAGWRYGAMIEGPRLLGLILEAPDFHLFRMSVDLGVGAKSGEIVLALPVPGAVPAEAAAEGRAAAGSEAGAALTGRRQLGQGALMEAAAPLSAVLHRIRLPLAEMAALTPGDVLHIPREALSDTRLEAGAERGGIACRLGQINGFRAVRLSLPRGTAGDGRGATVSFDAELDDDGLPELEAPRRGGAKTDGQAALPGLGLSDLPETGAGMTGQPDSLSDLPELDDLPELGGDDGSLGGWPDLPDLGDLSDLPELALDD